MKISLEAHANTGPWESGPLDLSACQGYDKTVGKTLILSRCLRIPFIEWLSGTVQPCGLTQTFQFLHQLPQLNPANAAHASPVKMPSEGFESTDVASTYGRLVVVHVNENIVPFSSLLGHNWQRVWDLPSYTLSVSVSAVIGIKTF